MLLVKTVDGSEYAGETAEQVVGLMKNRLPFGEAPMDVYMDNVAERVAEWGGQKLEFSSADEFLEELERIGVVTERRFSPKGVK